MKTKTKKTELILINQSFQEYLSSQAFVLMIFGFIYRSPYFGAFYGCLVGLMVIHHPFLTKVSNSHHLEIPESQRC